MAGYNPPDFNERAAAARAAKQKALDQLRNRPAPDPSVAAERQAQRERREAAAAERREARQHAAQEAKAVERAESASDLKRSKAVVPPAEGTPRTEEQLKAARDARYAARKARKR